MASKSDNSMNKAIIFHALLGLLVGVFARTYFHGLENYFGQQFDEFAGTVARSFQDGFATLAVKFLLFFISKCLQFRYLPAMFLASSTLCVVLGSIYSINLINVADNLL